MIGGGNGVVGVAGVPVRLRRPALHRRPLRGGLAAARPDLRPARPPAPTARSGGCTSRRACWPWPRPPVACPAGTPASATGLRWVATQHAEPDTRIMGEEWLLEDGEVVSGCLTAACLGAGAVLPRGAGGVAARRASTWPTPGTATGRSGACARRRPATGHRPALHRRRPRIRRHPGPRRRSPRCRSRVEGPRWRLVGLAALVPQPAVEDVVGEGDGEDVSVDVVGGLRGRRLAGRRLARRRRVGGGLAGRRGLGGRLGGRGVRASWARAPARRCRSSWARARGRGPRWPWTPARGAGESSVVGSGAGVGSAACACACGLRLRRGRRGRRRRGRRRGRLPRGAGRRRPRSARCR